MHEGVLHQADDHIRVSRRKHLQAVILVSKSFILQQVDRKRSLFQGNTHIGRANELENCTSGVKVVERYERKHHS